MLQRRLAHFVTEKRKNPAIVMSQTAPYIAVQHESSGGAPGPISKEQIMTFTRVQQPETSKVSEFIIEAITVTVLALSALLGLITIASA